MIISNVSQVTCVHFGKVAEFEGTTSGTINGVRNKVETGTSLSSFFKEMNDVVVKKY